MRKVQIFAAASLMLCLSVLCSAQSAAALKLYRCQGRVQYRPCDMPLSAVVGGKAIEFRSSTTDEPRARYSGSSEDPLSYAKLLSTRYALLPASYAKHSAARFGEWSGVVEGNGHIDLYLKILRPGHSEELLRMGDTILSGQSSSFLFKGAVPKEKNWSWEIIARPR